MTTIATPEQRLQDERTLTRLSRRYAQLGRSFSAMDQRERTALQAPLMELYIRLYPHRHYRTHDDMDKIVRQDRP